MGQHYDIGGDTMDEQFLAGGIIKEDVEILGDVSVLLVSPLGYLQRADFDILEDGLSYGSIQVWVGYGTVKTSVKKSIGTTRT
ncbi:hypothetical protein N8787_00760 [Opitutaceae bacterium]|nr:hypothetical protein [Opitutaceae bacterium]